MKPLSRSTDGAHETAGPDGWAFVTVETPGFVFALHPRDVSAFRRAWPRLRRDLVTWQPEVLVLLPFRRAPRLDHPSRRRIHSFGVASLDRKGLEALHGDAPVDRWAYLSCRDALRCGADGRAGRLLVRELPPRDRWTRMRAWLGQSGYPRLPDPCPEATPEPAVMVIPHAGELEPLEALLGLLAHQRPSGLRVVVGFDEAVGPEHRALVDRFADFEFWTLDPHGGGPYVFRAFVASRADEPWVIFQDSDDIPCIDRLPCLRAEAHTADVLGTWELQVDERQGRLKVVMFPVEADRAIRASGNTAQLHPTTIARSRALAEAGGLSTAHRFASDREIQLRMAFDSRLRNLDRVLYVRARREGTLSTAPDSAVKSEARAQLRERWDRAFRAVRDGGAALSDGGLGPEHGDDEITFTDLRTGHSERVRFGGPETSDAPS